MLLRGDSGADQRTVQVLLDAIQRVSASRDLEGLLSFVVDSAVRATGSERGLLVMMDEAGDLSLRVAREKDEKPALEDLRFSTSVVRKVLETGRPIRTTVSSEAEALELGASVFDLKLRGVMCVPLEPQSEEGRTAPAAGSHKGVLYVDSKAATRDFTDQDLALFHALAQHIAIALENARLSLQAVEKARLERSLEIASEIQAGLLPSQPKTIPGIQVHGWYRPAEHASGDFYDSIVTRDQSLAVVVGDVTGHGIGPALVTATAQAGLRSYAKVLDDPGAVVTMLGQDLSERMDDGMFLTLFLGMVTGDGQVRAVNAGHTPPLIWRQASGTIETFDGRAPALGFVEDYQYEVQGTIQLEPGDTLLLMTDGLVEARHLSAPDRLFGDAGVRAVLSEVGHSGGDAQAVCEALAEAVLAFCGGNREDDVTLLAVRRAPA